MILVQPSNPVVLKMMIQYGLQVNDELYELLIMRRYAVSDISTHGVSDHVKNVLGHLIRSEKHASVEIDLSHLFRSASLQTIVCTIETSGLVPNELCYLCGLLNVTDPLVSEHVITHYQYKPSVGSIVLISDLNQRYEMMRKFYPEIPIIDYQMIAGYSTEVEKQKNVEAEKQDNASYSNIKVADVVKQDNDGKKPKKQVKKAKI
jgi:hypothetical protein